MSEGDRPRYCEQCGSLTEAGDRFCGVCGARITPNAPDATTREIPTLVQPPQRGTEDQVTPTRNNRAFLVAGVVGVVLLLLVGGGALAFVGLGSATGLLGGSDPKPVPPSNTRETTTSLREHQDKLDQQEQSEQKGSMSDEEFRQLVDFTGCTMTDYEADAVLHADYEVAKDEAYDGPSLPAGIKARHFTVVGPISIAPDGEDIYGGISFSGAHYAAHAVHRNYPQYDMIYVSLVGRHSEVDDAANDGSYAHSYRNRETAEQIGVLTMLDESMCETEMDQHQEDTEDSGDSGTGGDANSPDGSEEVRLDQAVGDYYRAAGVEDWGYTYDHLDSQTQSMFTEEEWSKKNQWFWDLNPTVYHILSIESDIESDGEYEGSLAEVELRITGEDGSSWIRDTYFVKEYGEWLHRFSEEETDLFMPDATFEEFVEAHTDASP